MSLAPEERIIIPEDGVEYEYEVLTMFDIEELGHSYVAVIPVEQVDEEEAELFVVRYEEDEENEGQFMVFQIDDDHEWDLVEEVLNTLLDNDEQTIEISEHEHETNDDALLDDEDNI